MAEKGSQVSNSEAFKGVEAVLSSGNMSKVDLDSMSRDEAMGFFKIAVDSGVSPQLLADLFNGSNNEILHKMAKKISLPE